MTFKNKTKKKIHEGCSKGTPPAPAYPLWSGTRGVQGACVLGMLWDRGGSLPHGPPSAPSGLGTQRSWAVTLLRVGLGIPQEFAAAFRRQPHSFSSTLASPRMAPRRRWREGRREGGDCVLEKHLLIRHGGLWPRGQRWREEGGEGKHRWCLASRWSCGMRAVRWAGGDVGEWGWGMVRRGDALRGL